jgi:glycosyltransferase involved in cell wall biosynthesis
VRILIDYRPALRERTGVGEYVTQLVRALVALPAAGEDRLAVSAFTSSWKDRPSPAAVEGARVIDRRVPVRLLNFAWHRLEWPPVELIAGARFDVAHSPHPLLMPSRAAAQVVTIHDLDFMAHPERTRAEIRRDYPVLARAHAHRAHHVIVPSHYTARQVERQFELSPERIGVCPHGSPQWDARTPGHPGAYILFLGTLEPRKNVGGLLDAYARLLSREAAVPDLVLAGAATQAGGALIDRLAQPPLAGRVRWIGYVQPDERRKIYEGAQLLVLPSFDEGFGLPVLEAMSLGVPVVAADRGALPEVLGDAGLTVNPEDPEALACAIGRLVSDQALAAACSARGVLRARQFTWRRSAEAAVEAYRHACVEQRRRRGRGER